VVALDTKVFDDGGVVGWKMPFLQRIAGRGATQKYSIVTALSYTLVSY